MRLMRRYLLTFALILLQSSPTITIGQVDVSHLPEVTVYVSVTDAAGQPVRNLAQADFRLTEDGVPAEITGFAGIGDPRPVDVVFVFDTTGSMGNEIAGVIQTCVAFAEELERNGRDYRLGLVSFGDAVRGMYQPDGGLTHDVQVFKEWMSTLIADGGGDGPENPFGALKQAAQMQFRDGAQVIFILITDAPAHHFRDLPEAEGGFDDPDLTYERALSLLTAPRAITVYSVAYNDTEFRGLTSETGGRFYDIARNPDFTGIIDDIGEAIATQYRLTYLTPRPDYDGTRRNIRVEVAGVSGQGVYVEPHLLTIQSDLLVGVAFFLPLLLALAAPLIWMGLRGRKPMPQPMPTPPQSIPQPPSSVATVACPHCGRPVRMGAKFCASCGRTLTPAPAPPLAAAPARCAHCGELLRLGAKFCRKCGMKV
jgi:hypothetical protein